MTNYETVVTVQPRYFGEKERTLVEHGGLRASAFRFDSGVAGLRLENDLGYLILLPFQGQQVWSAVFGGRTLTMKSMFPQPRPTRSYLKTYGGFLLHCGATAMGVPSREDSHPLHGELPNARYQKAQVIVGEGRKPYIGLVGEYHHVVAFSDNYVARPVVKLGAGSSLFDVEMTITNQKRSEMELMYMAHINFRPVDGGRLVSSSPCTPGHVRVRKSIPSHVWTPPGYSEFIEELSQHPERHTVLTSDLVFDPEVVFTIDYSADDDGWAHSMQVHPDGSADYVRHRPDQLEKGVRWISRTPDQDALGLVLPATAEPEGYLAEKAKGNIKTVPPRGAFCCNMTIGTLTPQEVEHMEKRIARIANQGVPQD